MAVEVAGSINVDLIQSVEALPRPGETILALRSAQLPGGKGANQAVAAARMGAPVHMIGAIGGDAHGTWMRGLLGEERIALDGIRTLPGQPTGLALIAVDQAGENQIIVISGANAALAPAADWTFGAGARVLLAQCELPLETLRSVLAAPAASDCIRILNAAPALPGAAELFDLFDILIVNQHELAFYLGLGKAPELIDEALAARQLIRREGQIVIVTLGAGGALAVWQDRHFHAPALPVTPLDTIGAGDCFCGALAALLDGGQTVEAALPLANAAAGLCTLSAGAIPAMPSHDQVIDYMQAAPGSARPS